VSLTCTNHCSQCGRHFHSLEAFDVHHEHDETGWPVCLDPLDLEDRDGRSRLIALGVGECRVYPEVERDVTIWTTARYKRLGAYFDGPQSSDEAVRDDAQRSSTGSQG
jgi:hypothetical protein